MTTDINRENLDKSFESAKKALARAYDSDDAWDHLEEFAETAGFDVQVASVYRESLESGLPSVVFSKVAQRAVNFYDEWLGDAPGELKTLLRRIIEIDGTPSTSWAFNRLTEMLSSAAAWDELFDVYDASLERAVDDNRKLQLLEEAASIARDMADEPDRALNYLLSLQHLDKNNRTRLKLIERMLEKRERWEELIELWQQQLEVMTPAEKMEAQLEIAKCHVYRLSQFDKALDILDRFLSQHPGNTNACELGESILGNDTAESATRVRALDMVLLNYQSADQPEAVVRVVETALGFATTEQKIFLHRKAGTTLGILGKDEAAMENYAELLSLDPTDGDAIKQLRLLSVRSKRFDMRASALIRAANACDDEVLKVSHLTDAAELHVRYLNDATGAIEIYSGLLQLETIEASIALKIAHNLNELLAAQHRDNERLAVLEKIAELEFTSMVRRTVYQEAAKLAEQLTMPERALSFWNAVLKENENDIEALGASIRLMHQTEQWQEVIEYLHKRASAPVLKEQRRSDLVQVAVVQLNHVEDVDAAIDTWKSIFEEFGPRADCIGQLDTLLSQEGRFEELAQLLQVASNMEVEDMQGLLLRLGELSQKQLEQPEKALPFYRSVLALNVQNSEAIHAITELMEVPSCRAQAVHILERAFSETKRWSDILSMTDVRLSVCEHAQARTLVMEEAAQIYEKELDDPVSAFQMLCRLIPENPSNAIAVDNLIRLAGVTELWQGALAALQQARDNTPHGSVTYLQLMQHIARIQEEELDDPTGAMNTCIEISKISVADGKVLDTVIRLAARTASWAEGVEALAVDIRESGKIQPSKWQVLEDAIEDADDDVEEWKKIAAALNDCILRHSYFSPAIQRDLNLILSSWYVDYCDMPERARETAKRAVDATPDFLPARQKLAQFQRKAPSKALLENLKAIYRLNDDDLDPLMEAATIAVDILGEYEEARSYVVYLFEEAARLWRLGTIVKGKQGAEECVLHAVTQIAQLDLENGLKERAANFLMEGARLPFDEIRSRFLRKKAAAIYGELGMSAVAIDVYNQVLARNPDDLETLLELDGLLEREQRILELLAVRQKRLHLTTDADTQLLLRLDISSLGGLLEGTDSRLALLKENLQQSPGELRTILAMEDLLEKRGMHRELVELFKKQAEFLMQAQKVKEAAQLFETIARVAQTHLGDVELAIAHHRKVVEIKNNPQSLDALAKLYTQKGDLSEAVGWLKKRLAQAEPEERISTMIRLARTQLKIGHLDEGIAVLEEAFELAPQNAEVRKLLLERYREQKEYAKLASALERSIEHIHDSKTVLVYAMEAAHVIFEKLNQPRNAVDVLQRIVSLNPDAKEEQTMLAEALLDAERYDEARVLLEEILEGFGRRRSPARAAIHARLASVINAQGSADEAIAHLEQAVGMDGHNIQIAKELAEMARQKGDIDLAERTYRSLLMTVRRDVPASQVSIIGPAEILLELSFIAREKGQQDKQAELQESALEALRLDDSQSSAIEKRLLEAEEYAFLVKVLESRLGYLKKNVLRARVLGKLADILEYHLEQRERAFEIRLNAVTSDPGAPQNHANAIRLAKELSLYDEYIATVETLLQKARRDVDALTRCELLLRLVNARIESNDLKEATSLFEQAKNLEVREVDVLRTGAKLADATGDKELQVRLLTELSHLGESEDGSETHVDALFRLAEIHLSSEETFEEGIEQLNVAFTESGNCERAGRILRRISKTELTNELLLQVFERVARRSEDRYLSLEYYEMLAKGGNTTPSQIQEGARLAIELGEAVRAESLMTRVIESGEEHPEYAESIAWAMMGLGQRRLEQDDLAGAVKWFMDATKVVEDESVFEFGVAIAQRIQTESDDLILASRVYEKLLEMHPGAKEAWEPLTDIYLKLGNTEGFECLVEETMYSMENPAERNSLRQKWARLLLREAGREADAIDVLKNILLDEPGHQDALSLLSEYYRNSGRVDELLELLKDRFESALERRAENEVTGLALELGRQIEDTERLQAIYRQALEISPNDRGLLLAMIDVLDPEDDARERVMLMERTLGTEDSEHAVLLTLKVAAAYREMNDSESASRTLQIGFSRNPASSELKTALEQDFRARGDYEGLADMLKASAVTIEGERARLIAWGEIADLYKNDINDVFGELDALQQMAGALEGNAEFTIRIIDAYRRAGKYDEALTKVQESLDTVADDANKYELLVLRARMLKSRGSLDAALDDLELAVSLNEEASELFESMLIEKRAAAALDQDAPAEKDVIIRLTRLYVHQGRESELLMLLQSWLNDHSDDVEAWRQLLQLERSAENFEGVIEVCKKLTVLTSGEEQIEIGGILTEACTHTGQLEIARRGLEYIYKENIDGVQVREQLKDVYEKIGAHHELATFLAHDAKSAEDDAQRADLFRRAGDAYLRAGDPDTALLALNESLALDPENLDSALLVIDIEIEQGNLDVADEHTDAALEASGPRRSPQHASLQLRKAMIAERRGDRIEQLSWLEQAAASSRTDGHIAAALAELAEELEDWDTALKALRNISLMKSDCPLSKAESFFRQGRISYRMGDEKRAILYLKKALQEDKDHGEAEAFLQQIS